MSAPELSAGEANMRMEVDTHGDVVSGDEGDEAVSPTGRRRSTRQSALRAQERIKGADGPVVAVAVVPELENSGEADGLAVVEADEPEGEVKTKKRKLAKELNLNQWDPHFGIKYDEETGDVAAMSDDSEISSLNENEVEYVRKNYEKIVSEELVGEQRRERERMIRQLEMELREEEARLVILKKIRLSQQQQVPAKEAGQHNSAAARQMLANKMGTTATGANAYKPPVAPLPSHRQGNNHNTAGKGMISGNRHQQQIQQAHQGKPQVPPNLQQMSGRQLSSQQQTQMTNRSGLNVPGAAQQQSSTSMTTSRPPQPPAPPSDNLTPAQRQAQAKLALRKQLEKTLLSIPPPKPPAPELLFIPNLNVPEFICMMGLDLVVQRVTRDRRHQDVPNFPYCCSQCRTDFTPLWKAVDDSLSDTGATGHRSLMCEACVRTNQKKALKAEHTNRLKQAFVKALQQEQEIEKQIKEGKFDNPPAPATPPMQQKLSTAVQQSSSQQHRQTATVAHQSIQRNSPVPNSTRHHSSSRSQLSNNTSASASSSSSAALSQQQAAAAALQRAVQQNPMQNSVLHAMVNAGNASNPINQMFPQQLLAGAWNPALAGQNPAMAELALQMLAARANAGGMQNMLSQAAQQQMRSMQQQTQQFQRQLQMLTMIQQQQQQQQPKGKK